MKLASLNLYKVGALSVGVVILAILIPYLTKWSSPAVPFIPEFLLPGFLSSTSSRAIGEASKTFVCLPHNYRSQLISLNPLVIYIHSFITRPEIESLLNSTEPKFGPSRVNTPNGEVKTSDRTSWSATLWPHENAAVECILDRAYEFMGTMMREDWDEIDPPQLVRYTSGQYFNLHRDWYERPMPATDGTRRTWNRIASFFAILQDNCTGGETYFPHVRTSIAGPNPQTGHEDEPYTDGRTNRPLWREHEDGGLAFRPVRGNAIFWVNLFENGTGDWRTMHAGLPLKDGQKTAMNIWPVRYEKA